MADLVNNNSEILFLYDAKQCNPNGDMDNENKPRMDLEAGRNLVSDVRLKRYVREYLMDIKEKPIFVRKLGDRALEAEKALALFKLLHIDGKTEDQIDPDKDLTKDAAKEAGKRVFELADVRLFGATIPFKIEGARGSSQTFTGPTQFNWGYSLNRIYELQESNTITSHLRTGKSEAGAGIGKDYRINYAMLAFSGGINANTAKTTHMTKEDVDLLDEAMIKSIPLNRTRSKIGQTPRFYMRVEMNDNQHVLNDLREYLDLEVNSDLRNESEIRSIKDYEIDAADLQSYLESNRGNISKVHYWKDDLLKLNNLNLDSDLFQPLTVQ